MLPLLQQSEREMELLLQGTPTPEFSIGTLIIGMLISIAFQALFGWWAMQKAEEHGVNPWVAFAAGFFFLYLGVRLVPILTPSRILPPSPTPRRLPPRPPPQIPAGYQAQGSPPPPPAPLTDCPACGTPIRSGRKSCMSCGTPYPQ